MFTVVVAFHVERPAKITDRDSADHPFPSRELIGVSPGPSRYWPVRGSPVPRRVTGHAALVQVFNPVRQPARHRRDQNHRSRNRPNPTSRRGHAPTAPAGPVLRQQGFHSPSRPHRCRPFRCLHRPANRFPRHHERSRRDRQPEPCSRGMRDRQDPNQNQPPGRVQTRRLEEQPRRTDPPHLPTPICPASPTSDAAPANPKISLGQPHRYHAGIPGSSRLHTPPITHTPVPRETGQRTRVTHKSPPALNADQAMNLFRDKTIKLLNRTMRIARVCFAFEDGADALPKHEAHIQHIRTFLFVDPRSGAPAAGHAAATGSRKHGSVPRETERVRPSMLRTPPEGRTPSSIRLLTTPHALNRDGWFHVKRVAVIPFHWIGCARPTTFRALLTAR